MAPDAQLAAGVSVQPGAVIGPKVRIGAGRSSVRGSVVGAETSIGEDSLVHPLVSIRERCVIGSRVILHSGVVIGGDGFGYEFRDGRHIKIEHTGIVQIDDDVEIGANSTVDRARFGKTHIGTGAKIDNLVMIAHNVVIGPMSIVVAQTGISGSTILGRGVVLAGQVGLAGHLKVGGRRDGHGAVRHHQGRAGRRHLLWPSCPPNSAKASKSKPSRAGCPNCSRA